MLPYRLILGFSAALATPFSAFADINTSGFHYSVYGGAAYSKINPGNLVFIGETDSLVPNESDHQQTNFTGGLGAAYHFLMSEAHKGNPLHDASIGLDFFYFKTTQKGEIWQFQLPAFNNFTYDLPVSSARLMANSELTFNHIGSRLFPFIQGGIGMASNRASYNDVPVPGIGGNGVVINADSQYQFVYALGGGVKILLNQKLNLSFRYVYSDLGNVSTAQTSNFTLLSPIKSTLSTQDFLVGLTYMA